MTKEKAMALRAMIEKASSWLSDTDGVEAVELFPAWAAGQTYRKDQRVRSEDKLYRVLQAHRSQADWPPALTPALYARIAKPGEIPVWQQPAGAEDAYRAGDRVLWPDADGAVYESLSDGNVWSPGAWPEGWARLE